MFWGRPCARAPGGAVPTTARCGVKFVLGFLGGVVGGVVGAAIWAAVTYFTHYEIGWMAVLLGACVGLGWALCSSKRGGAVSGVVAALIAIAAVFGGKFAVAHFMVQDFITGQSSEKMTDADAMDWLAGDVLEHFENTGRSMSAPSSGSHGFPPEVWAQADAEWSKMDEPTREGFKREREAMVRANVKDVGVVATIIAFLGSFGLWDLLWLGFSATAAFRFASARGEQPLGEVAGEPVLSPGATAGQAKAPAPVKTKPMASGEAPEKPAYGTTFWATAAEPPAQPKTPSIADIRARAAQQDGSKDAA